MADSNITKKALSTALRELMEETPFKKISVADICARCDMNRKSFYYHFRDKYDLVNWIFDTEFISLARNHANDDRWEFIEAMCCYFYENRAFYSKALQIKGQNSFSEHFRAFIHPLLRNRITDIVGTKDFPDMCVDFFVDGILCAMERWLMDKNCVPPSQFISSIRQLLELTAAAYHKL